MHNFTLRNTLVIFLLSVGVVYVQWYQTQMGRTLTAVDGHFSYVTDLTFWRKTQYQQIVSSLYPLDLDHDLSTVIPLKIAEWSGITFQTDVGVLVMLEPEQYIERLYTNDDRQHLWLHVVGGRNSKTFHPPEVCYVSDGWEHQVEPYTLELPNGVQVTGVLIDAMRNEQDVRQLSFYFFLFAERSRQQNDGITMLRTTTPLYGSIEETMRVQAGFLSNLFANSDVVASDAPLFQHPTNVIADKLRLLGYSLDNQKIAAGSAFNIELLWERTETSDANYKSHIVLKDNDGIVWSRPTTDRPHFQDERIHERTGNQGDVIQDSWFVAPLTGTPPGQYDVVLSVTNNQNGSHFFLYDERGNPLGIETLLGQVEIEPFASEYEFRPQFTTDLLYENVGIRLLGYNIDRAQAQPGDTVLLNFFWRKENNPIQNHITLTLESEKHVHHWEIHPVRNGYDLSRMGQDEMIRGQHSLNLPAHTETGEYQLYLGTQFLGQIDIHAPERVYENPKAGDLFVEFEKGIRLASLNVSDDENKVTLVWQTEKQIEERLRVFVHVLDEKGDLIAQSDQEPSNWERPTNSWLPTEFVIDEHDLANVGGIHSIRLGMYNPITGKHIFNTEQKEQTIINLRMGVGSVD